MLKKLKTLRQRTNLHAEIKDLKTQHGEAIRAWREAHLNQVNKSEEKELAKFANSLQLKLLQKEEELRSIS